MKKCGKGFAIFGDTFIEYAFNILNDVCIRRHDPTRP